MPYIKLEAYRDKVRYFFSVQHSVITHWWTVCFLHWWAVWLHIGGQCGWPCTLGHSVVRHQVYLLWSQYASQEDSIWLVSARWCALCCCGFVMVGGSPGDASQVTLQRSWMRYITTPETSPDVHRFTLLSEKPQVQQIRYGGILLMRTGARIGSDRILLKTHQMWHFLPDFSVQFVEIVWKVP